MCAKVNGDVPLKTSCPIRFMEDIGHRVGTKPITWLQHGGESLEVGIGSNGAKYNISTLFLTTKLKVVCELPKREYWYYYTHFRGSVNQAIMLDPHVRL